MSSLSRVAFASIALFCLCHRNQIGCEFAALVVSVQSTGFHRPDFLEHGLKSSEQNVAVRSAGNLVNREFHFFVGEADFHA
jgi:uncharacterized NAD(P)/FAD-binding protein YdhS